MFFDDLFAVPFESSVKNPDDEDYDPPQSFIDEQSLSSRMN